MSTDYAALADTIKIEDITSKELNREILHKLKNNDESFDKIFIMQDSSGDGDDYIPDDGEDLGWLGHFIGQNTKLLELQFYRTIGNESFYKEVSHNKSINKVFFYANNNRLVENIFRMMSPFSKNNYNLNEIEIDECDLRVEDSRQLSLAITGVCSQLKKINFSHNTIGTGQLVNIITALSLHPQLEVLCLPGMSIGRNECTALSTLLQHTTTQLQKLYLSGNNIDDEGVEVLVNALSNGNKIEVLDLSWNEVITIKGWKEVATLLEMPDTKLETLNIANNNMGNDGALVFANALKYNSTLKTLLLSGSGITSEGWAPFSKLLCDISSVNT